MALCFTAVMGITLAGYIAVCSRAMNLSNLTFQNNLSKQLAETGIDEALRAFNKNDWSNWASNPTNVTSGAWTLDTTNKRATRTITFDPGKLGQGITGTIKMRIDNYDANQLGSTYVASATYRINDLVGHNGIWYRSVQNGHSGNTPVSGLGYPNLNYWVPIPIPWSWCSNTSYTADSDLVCYNGTWYRCSTTHTSGSSFSASSWAWTSMPAAPTLAITTFTTYTAGTFGFRVGDSTWYRCITTHTINASWDATVASKWQAVTGASPTAPYISWGYRSTVTYNLGDVVFYSSTTGVAGTWYRCIAATSTGNLPTNTTYWENALSGANTTTTPGVHGWSSNSMNYNLGDTVYYGTTGQWYRCILAHTSSGSITPSDTTYWSNAPLSSRVWDSNRQYSQYDTVRYNGVRYLSLQNSNTNQNPVTAMPYWIGANTSTASYQWSAATAYSAGVYKCYGGVWYKCLTANTGQSPNNTTYWTATWAQGAGVTTGAPVVYAEGKITLDDRGTVATTDDIIVRTQLRATIAAAPLFPNAVAATTTISANSGGTVDSYDSTTGTIAVQNGIANTTTPNFNSGTYASHVGSSTNYSAVVAAGDTTGTAVTLSTTAVKGYVAAPSSSTSPYAPLFSSGGSVKSLTSPASPNIDLTRVSRSPYIPQFTTLPSGGLATTWANVPKGSTLVLSYTTNIGTPGATTPSRYYYNGNLTVGTGSLNLLRINGPVILYINGDLFITNSGSIGRIEITSTGSAEVHVAGAFKADAGGEGIVNYPSDPKSLIIISDTTSTATHFYSEGVNDLYGIIYIPYSTSNTGFYNDNTNTEIFGAVSANKITYSGANLNVHYDTSLRYATFGGVDQPYTVNEWRELPVTEQATMP